MRSAVTASFVLAFAAGCASKGAAPAAATAPTSTPAPAPAAPAPAQVSASFTSSYERVWQALQAAYPSLGLKVNAIDTTAHALGFSGIVRRKIGKMPISTYFGCGMSAGDHIADSYDVTLVVASQVTRSPDGRILVTTHARAGARAPQFSSDNARCTTNGRLERALFDSLTARLR